MPTDTPSYTQWRARPVFISSTFKDMQAERDHLRDHVFPRLEEVLRARHHRFEPIDLRLGVETADVASVEERERLVLKVCLEEIQRSRPFLLVLLGDRYGWVPPRQRMEDATREAGINTAGGATVIDITGKSVTALEIEYGVLREHPDQQRRSFFYFRDPLPYDRMEPATAALYSDEHSPDPEVRAGHGQLVALKAQLAADPELGPHVHAYHATWDETAGKVTRLAEWGEAVFQHLWAVLDAETRDFASQAPATWEEVERHALAEFISQRSRDFTGRAELLDQLHHIATGPIAADIPPGAAALFAGLTWGACVSGVPGSGKSALLAELHRRLAGEPSLLILANAAGGTPRGAEPDAMLRRFVGELAVTLGEPDPLPMHPAPDELDAAFASLLARAALQTRVVVLLDALDQFDATARSQHLTWFRPRVWPANARLIATGITATAPVEALSQWAGVEELELLPLDPPDVAEIARLVWARYHRQVNPAVLRVLAEKTLPDGTAAAGNPLWLTLALEQINLLDSDDFARAERDFAEAGGPAEQLRALLVDTAQKMPPDVPALYGWLLAQTEKTFGTPQARAFAALIALGRFGWRETDLLALVPLVAALLDTSSGVALAAFTELDLASLRRGFRAHLTRRGAAGQLDFFHAQMRQAVAARTLGDPAFERAIHHAIAGHLETLAPIDPLRETELMVHLIGADDPERAARVLAELPFYSVGLRGAIEALVRHLALGRERQTDAARNWVAALPAQPTLSPDEVYAVARRFLFDLDDALAPTANLSTRQTLIGSAQAALTRLTAITSADAHEFGDMQRDLSVSLNKLGDLAKAKGDGPGAARRYTESLAIRERLAASDPANAEWQRDLSVLLNKLGDLAVAQGDGPGAARRFTESLAIAERLAASDPANAAWQRDLSFPLNKLGDLAKAKGDWPGAARLFTESHAILERLAASDPANAAWQRELSVSLGKLGDLAVAQGDGPGAARRYTESLAIAERLGASDPTNAEWQRDLSVSQIRLGDLSQDQGDLPSAARRFTESLAIRERLAANDPANAEWQRELSQSQIRLGELAKAQGDLPGAARRFTESLAIRERLAARDPANAEWQRDLSVSLERLGDLAVAQGDGPGAARRYTESLAIAERLCASDPTNAEWQRDLSVSLNKLGDLSQDEGDLPSAARRFTEILAIRERLAASDPANAAWQRDLSVSFERLGYMAQSQGDLTKAMEWFEKSRANWQDLIDRDPSNLGLQRGIAVPLQRLGDLAVAQGDLPGAARCFTKMLAIFEHLTASDPSNAGWQRDLWVSYWTVAVLEEKKGEAAKATHWWRKAHDTLAGMKQRGLPFSLQDEGFLARLKVKAGG